jgi:RNA polymerase sigma factor (sigma-70 family)
MEASPTSHDALAPPAAAGSKLLMVQPDAVLCALCSRGSDDAFTVLHARYHREVFAFVYHLLGRASGGEDAEDLTQEIFSKAFSSLRTRRPGGSFKGWLFAIARNHTFDHIRVRKPNTLTLEEGVGDEASENVVSIVHQVERKAELDWLVAAVADLPERQREALVMRELAGMSYGEIATSLDTSAEGAKQLIKRGRATVSNAAERDGYRSRKLGRDLAMAAPVVPLAATGFGVTAGSASAASAAGGFGLFAVGGKTVATVLAVAVVGSGAAVSVEKVASSSAESSNTAKAPGASSADRLQGPAAVGGAAVLIAAEDAKNPHAKEAREAKQKLAERKAKRAKAKARVKLAKEQAKSRGKAKRAKAKERTQLAAKNNGGSNRNSNSTGSSVAKKPQKSPPQQSEPSAAPEPVETPAPASGSNGKGAAGGSAKSK